MLLMFWMVAVPVWGASHLPVTVEDDAIHIGGVTVSFQRTLRVPDDGRVWNLPPGFGRFPIRRVEDYAARVPASWRRRGGVMIPMYQREALWIDFRASSETAAVKVAAGMVNALTGDPWSERLSRRQDYVVVPDQPWLDGFKTGRGVVRQFVAMPLGSGSTVEGQVTGEERYGGLQIIVFPARESWPGRREGKGVTGYAAPQSAPGMGLGEGGSIVQRVTPDPYGYETWDQGRSGRIYVHIVNGRLWRAITGERLPSTPVRFETYQEYGFPWIDAYEEDLAASSVLQDLAPVEADPDGGDGSAVQDGDW